MSGRCRPLHRGLGVLVLSACLVLLSNRSSPPQHTQPVATEKHAEVPNGAREPLHNVHAAGDGGLYFGPHAPRKFSHTETLLASMGLGPRLVNATPSVPLPALPGEDPAPAMLYRNTTGPLYIDPTLPFPSHTTSFLVAVGVMSMDSAFGATRRDLIRQTWITYSDVWTPRRTHGSVLVKFVVGRHELNRHEFTEQLREEARQVERFYDVVALSLFERKSSMGKSDSSKYGLWGLAAMLTTAFKSIVWRRVAIAQYRTDFVAKADDDIFLNVPQYVATLRVLPRRRTSWGLHAIAQRDPGHSETSFPYCLGPLATTSADLANISSASPIASLLSQPFNGHPSDYFSKRCDHEDYSTYSAIDVSGVPMHVFHDCSFVEPFLHGELYVNPPALVRNASNLSLPLHAPGRLDPAAFVNFHKLNKNLFAAARLWFPDVAGAPREFVKHPSPVLPSRYDWHSTPDSIGNRCGPLFVANYHTRWGELGPMKYFLRREGELHPCPYQDLHKMTDPLLLALGVWTQTPEQRAAFRRVMRQAPEVWSWHNRSSPVLVRFPTFSTKPVSLDAYWECHRYQDMVAVNTRWRDFSSSGPLRRLFNVFSGGGETSRHALLWMLISRRLYPTAEYVGVLLGYGVPADALSFFSQAKAHVASTRARRTTLPCIDGKNQTADCHLVSFTRSLTRALTVRGGLADEVLMAGGIFPVEATNIPAHAMDDDGF